MTYSKKRQALNSNKIISSLYFFYRSIRRKVKYCNYDNPVAKIPISHRDVCIDCGANIGKITEIMSYAGATVYAFEPNPFAFKVLSGRFEGSENIHCINKGVLDHPDKMKLFLHENAEEDQITWSTGSSLLVNKPNVDINNYIDVEIIDLIQFIIDLNVPIKVLKLDVEGVEYPIINKIIDSGLIDNIQYIFVETHEDKIPELRKIAEETRKRIQIEGIQNIYLDWE